MNYIDITKVESTPFCLRSDLHLVRKAWHIATGLIGLWVYFRIDATSTNFGFILLAIAAIGFIVDFSRLRNKRLNQLALYCMRPFMRESEKHGFSGLPFYALGTGLSLILFSEKIAILSILFLILADPISSFVGILFGKDKILPNKSLQGIVSGFIVCYCISLIYGLSYSIGNFNIISFSLIAGVIGAGSELLSVFKIDDNLTIPVVSGLGISLINLYFNIL